MRVQRRCHQVVIRWADLSKPSFQVDKAGVEGHEGAAIDRISHQLGKQLTFVGGRRIWFKKQVEEKEGQGGWA